MKPWTYCSPRRDAFRQNIEVVMVKPFLTLGGEIHLYLITRLQALFALQEQFKNLRSRVHDGFISQVWDCEAWANLNGVRIHRQGQALERPERAEPSQVLI